MDKKIIVFNEPSDGLPLTRSRTSVPRLCGHDSSASRCAFAKLVIFVALPWIVSGCFGGPPSGDDGTPNDAGSPGTGPSDNGSQAEFALPCLNCHASPMGSRPALVDESGAGGHTLGRNLNNADCKLCHETTKHAWGGIRLWQNPLRPEEVIEAADYPSKKPGEDTRVTEFCRACHDEADYAVHQVRGDWQPACTECHTLHDPSSANLTLVSRSVYNRTLDVDKPVVFGARTGPGSFDDGDPAASNGICQVCHTDTFYHQHDESGTTHFDGEDCMSCHPHKSGFIPTDETSCLLCHSRPQRDRHAVVDASGAGGHDLQDGVLTEADCALCHEMTHHRQGSVRLWADPNDPSSVIELSGDPKVDVAAAEQLTPFCEACHDNTRFTAHTVEGSWKPACTECHNLHDPANTNLALLSPSIRNQTVGIDKPVEFSALTGPGSFSAADVAARDGICQVCHTATQFHLHDGTGASHLEGENCTTCHAHDAGFVPDASTSCSICHSVAQGVRRAITSEFSLASSHVHGEIVPNVDCIVCHEMTEHRQGEVRLKNVDDPENPAAAISLSDSPFSSPGQAAALEVFCLACHDEDGADGAAPFTDKVIPPPIDAELWASASHGSGQMTCVGNGETFGCHSSGHGSLKANLLAPWDGSQPVFEGDTLRQEEGLCYSCHDEDGPATSDIESEFALATHHDVSALDQADGSRVECTHCHNPHEVRQGAQLTDPGSGSLWTQSGEAFCLTCHGGSVPAGVSFPPTSPGTGFDKSAFVDTTHDSRLGDNSCRHCHRAHGSSHLAMLKERYVVDDYNEYSTGDGDFEACWLCHDEDNTIERENAFEYRHEKHVKDERSPCIICHDVHAGFDAAEPGLINMAYSVQRGGYDITFIDGADPGTSFSNDDVENEGNCLIMCHGEEHDPKDYDREDLQTTDCSACH